MSESHPTITMFKHLIFRDRNIGICKYNSHTENDLTLMLADLARMKPLLFPPFLPYVCTCMYSLTHTINTFNYILQFGGQSQAKEE